MKRTQEKMRTHLCCPRKVMAIFTIAIFMLSTSMLFAQVGTTQPEQPAGAGTQASPYLISNLANLRWMSENSAGWWVNTTTQVYFRQTADIDAYETREWNAGVGFTPIGHQVSLNGWNSRWFQGVYDGGGHVISNLYFNGGTQTYLGMFHVVTNSTIMNLGLKDVNFLNTGWTGYTGALVGMLWGATIEDCWSSGEIRSVGIVNAHSGGLVGSTTSSANIQRSHSSATITSLNGAFANAGGIAGMIGGETVVNECFSTGEINSSGENSAAGGISGELNGGSIIRDSYSTGVISAVHNAGGIAGKIAGGSVIREAYSVANISTTSFINTFTGAIAGLLEDSFVINCFWDIEVTGLTHATENHTPNTNLGLTTIEMKDVTNFMDIGWDFDTVWGISESINSGYPHLRAFDYEEDIDDPGDIFNPPAGLTAVLSGTIVELAWEMPVYSMENERTEASSAATGERVLSSFRIYRNGTQIAENVFTTFFTDENVVNDMLYVYHVIAVYENPDGESEPSNVAELHTMFPPRDLTYAFDGSNIELRWVAPGFEMYNGEWRIENGVVNQFLQGMPCSNSTDAFMLSEISYNIYRDDILQNQNPITTLSWVDTNTTPETRYVYEVTAVYEAGESAPVEIIIVTSGFEFSPPKSLSATVGDGLVHLTWQLPDADPDVHGLVLNQFKVYRDGDPLADGINQTQYFDHEVINQTPYSYYVTAVYTYMDAIVESVPSNIFEIVTRFPVRNLTATSVRFDVRLDWEAPSSEMYNGEWIMENGMLNSFLQGMPCSNGTDAFMLSAITYNIYRDDTLLTPTPLTDLTFTDDRTTPAEQYIYRVNAVYDGIESPSVERQIIIPLFTPPTGLVASADEKGNVEISWTAPSEMLEFEVLLGYRVYRDDLLLTDSINASVRLTDKVEVSGEYVYKVIAVYELGESDPIEEKVYITVSEDDISILPITTELVGNYPNPFNPETVIRFNIADAGNVNIEIFNIRGQKVRTLVDGFVERGEHTVVWNGTDENGRGVSSGVYFYVMRADGVNASLRRMVLLK